MCSRTQASTRMVLTISSCTVVSFSLVPAREMTCARPTRRVGRTLVQTNQTALHENDQRYCNPVFGALSSNLTPEL